MIETHKIIVLSALKYSDDKLIVRALSRAAGRVTLLVNVTHSTRAAVRYTLFQPLAILEVTWESNPRTTMFKPKSARPDVQLLSMQTEPAKATVAMFLAEFLSHATAGDFDGGLLFDYISYALQWFDTAERGYANFHLIFLLRLSRLLGIDPNVGADAYRAHRAGITASRSGENASHSGGHTLRTSAQPLRYFNLQDGEFASTRPDHIYYIEGGEAAFIPTLMRFNFSTMHLLHLNGAQRSRILESILTYYRLHLPGIPELKSLDVLRAVFKG